ncbi:MAG: MMPL family transporter [Acidimicrobiia bacterium]
MFTRLHAALLRRHRTVLLVTALAVPMLAVLGGGVQRDLSVGGFVDRSTESARVARHLEQAFGTAAPNEVLVLTMLHGTATDEANADAGRTLVARLRTEPGVADVLSPWTLGSLPAGAPNPLIGDDARRAVIALRLGGDEDAQRRTAERLSRLTGEQEAFRIGATGPAEISRQAAEQAERDLLRAELVAAPLTLIGLLVVFRGWRAALLPLGVAVVAVLGTFCVLRLLATVTTVSVFALNLTTGLGLGLAVDYSLLLVARFREERTGAQSVPAAVQRTVRTAGRTVLFSAVTVALSLLALLVMPVPYLRSFAYAGVTVVFIAAAAALVVVPAALLAIGARIGRARIDRRADAGWAAQARRVMARPVWWAVAVAVPLLVAGVPFGGLHAGRIDDRILPAGAGARLAAEELRAHFDQGEFHPINVAVPWLEPSDTVSLRRAVQTLAAVPGVTRVDSALGFSVAGRTIPPTDYHARFTGPPGAGTWFSVTTAFDPESDDARAVVRAIRALDGRAGVSGATAATIDAVDGVQRRAPWAAAVIAVTTVVLLFVMTGSVVVPLKALVLNLASLTATFGALVWVFQDGHLAGLLGVSATGRLDVFTPILMFCIAFGLSMDYEVFLLAAIKEHYDLHGDNAAAVAHGLGRSGRVVTAAAGLLTIVFVAIGTSGVVTVRMIGAGLALAVLVDAFLIRATLVPALMRLTGEANWWAPGPLRRWQLRHGWREPAALPFPTLADAGGHREEAVAAVLGHPCFDRARPALAAVVARHVELVAPTPGAVLAVERAPAPGLVVLCRGSAVRSAAGLVEAMLAPGAAFGAELLDGGISPATVVAGSDALLAVVAGPHLRAIDRAFRLSRGAVGTPPPPPPADGGHRVRAVLR